MTARSETTKDSTACQGTAGLVSQVRERPIIFSAPMVRAILDGRKTQTRRLIKAHLPDEPTKVGGKRWGWVDGRLWFCGVKLPYAPGDRLWVRERWGIPPSIADAVMRGRRADKIVHAVELAFPPSYDTYNWPIEGGKAAWRSPIHMPRWASRITLLVEEVRVQRLQEISHDEAVAEGVGIFPHSMSAEKRFSQLWDSLHRKPGTRWADNPWVAAIKFKRL